MRPLLLRCVSLKLALLRHANEHLECLLSEVFRKSGFRLGRTGFDPQRTSCVACHRDSNYIAQR
jgi:hypothetical protein